MKTRLRVRPSGPLRGRLRVPSDKSIGHRALLFAALAEGDSRIRGIRPGLDVRATARALGQMGIDVSLENDEARVRGAGLRGLRMPRAPIDCENSGTTMRLLAGLLCAQHFGTRLVGDASLSRRPMRRVVEPLRARGAHIAGHGAKTNDGDDDEIFAPLAIAPLLPEESLLGLEIDLPVASAQVKTALLLSGLYAREITAIREPTVSRDHTERMLLTLGVPLEALGPMMVLDPKRWSKRWDAFDWEIPGDLSSAAFLLAAASVVPGSTVEIERVGVNPTRTGLLDVLRSMRADVSVVPSGVTESEEPLGTLRARHTSPLAGGRTSGELLTRMIDEVPAFCVFAALARTDSEVDDARELRVKESDRIASMAALLRAFGREVVERDEGMTIVGSTSPLVGAEVDSHGDHRVAMAAAVLGLVATGETIVHDAACIETSFPGFARQLAALGADIVEEVEL